MHDMLCDINYLLNTTSVRQTTELKFNILMRAQTQFTVVFGAFIKCYLAYIFHDVFSRNIFF